MLNEWGEVDEDIDFEFIHLWEMDDEARARIRKSDADADCAYVNTGIVSTEEVRERLAEDEQGLYFGVDLSGPAPELPEPDSDLDDGDKVEAAE